MKTYTRQEIQLMALEGDSLCLKCGARNYGVSEDSPAPCEECGALAVVPAENIAQVLTIVEED